ncbi:MAG: hypothetical protein NC205_05975 [Prevotella sp.]|nr:hypothetical protein [Alistipes senegalensis]MCM1358124.1 hypothetical protein [Prevotella sp.]MCM1473733.1 hypothetical protein [Muribaculaceae bacterium]MDE6427286.1 hypothetical protein [Ruminococcus sp.]
MKVKLFSSSFQPAQEKYERVVNFEDELNDFLATVDVIDIKYSTALGMCHDAQTHVNEYMEDFSVLIMYNDKK